MLAGLALVTLAVIITGYAGFRIGQGSIQSRPDYSRSIVQHQLERQQASLDEAIEQAKKNVDALSLKLGELQAHTLRLDALGSRLVDMARLDKGEFDFSAPPALGGPRDPSALETQSIPDFVAALQALSERLKDRAPKLSALEDLFMNQKLQAEVRPAGQPAVSGWISSGYGHRTDPLTGKRAFHAGIDFAGSAGASVIAVASGVVTRSGYWAGVGNMVEINHGNGYVTRYAHNRKNLVRSGDAVKKGQPIAMMGNTGRSTGSHVHFEVVFNGKTVDPIQYVRVDR